MLTNTTSGADQARRDPVPQILLVNPASTPSPHKTFEPNIYPNLGLLTLATALQRALPRGNVAAEVIRNRQALQGRRAGRQGAGVL